MPFGRPTLLRLMYATVRPMHSSIAAKPAGGPSQAPAPTTITAIQQRPVHSGSADQSPPPAVDEEDITVGVI